MPERKLSRYTDVQDEPDGCAECGSPNYLYADASDYHGELPEKPLCRTCILKRA